MAVDLQVLDDKHEADEVMSSALDVLTGRDLLTLATQSSELGPHANSAFFAVDDLVLFFLSERTTVHSQNLDADQRVSASVFLDPPQYGEGLRGIQVWGTAREVSPEERPHAMDVLRRRFPTFAADPAVRDRFLQAELPSVFYRIDIDRLTVLDEPRFGRRVYVSASVRR
ncbi:pyridoxamine 5'-phosphate oxidase family protein [Actinoplanes sp. NPDC049265]|uniref:pyridoxamine 5'-phosphate oxidase family protein n=1 Tax=Actinoplanes sp. NPDC049265 TaxID=3363902 RepID=UPI003716680B